ncbi:FHA-HIT protein [Ectocarpus siliculosus]|uniref:FHA-HIT protein n=1 Tax=Ectocarpus siliculosus TaxID=2880 RepID=D8LEA7_ECTSI|nr:FHA-HIT protein [Ectocarpus siliculosus]|eukprot:CBN74191.1 FHA-HIT protein [Ectocarpus siliculosus]
MMDVVVPAARKADEGDVAPVAVAAALDFLSSPCRTSARFPGLRVVFAAEEGSTALVALREHAPALAEAGHESRLVMKACALPDVSKAGARCAYLVNPCNWRLVAGGARTNMLVNRAAGDSLRQGSLEGGRTRALVAEPFAVKLSQDSPLRSEGVDTVIQVLGPNLDPRFPECLANEPDRARYLLRQCYDKTLDSFWKLVSSETSGAAAVVATPTAAADTAAAASAAAAPGASGGGGGGHCSGSAAAADTGVGKGAVTKRKRALALPEYRRTPPTPVKGAGHWKAVLFQYLKDEPMPVELQREVYFSDNQCVVVYDGYPKSRYHLLLLPKPKFLDVKQASELRRDEHLSSLRQLHATATAVAEALSQQGAGVIRCGYHGIPSLEPLHLHIISQDFDSERLTKRKHWNSFTTDFFLDASWVEARLLERGSLGLDKERLKALEATPLRCFRCHSPMTNMTKLKEHLLGCNLPVPKKNSCGGGGSSDA